MKIAIVGAGFCGLAVAWHFLNFLQHSNVSVEIFDSNGIGSGASGIAAGLLHSFAGLHCKLNWQGIQGMQATQELLDVASKALNQSVTSARKGIIRLIGQPQQLEDYRLCANRYPEHVEWITQKECRNYLPFSASSDALFIKEGQVVDSRSYLKGLWMACSQKGAVLTQQTISHLDELADYDSIILTAGKGIAQFIEKKLIKLTYVKGQILEMNWPSELDALKYALNSQAYLIMQEYARTCLVGSSFEKNFTSELPDVSHAKQEILPKICGQLPVLKNEKILNCYAGVRVATPSNRPEIYPLESNCWALTGMGSKGLLYHALYAKTLVEIVMASFKNF